LVVVDKADGGDLMRGFSQFIAIVDFEATALSKAADVIEVGVAIFDRIWMANLFHEGKVEPAFAIEPIEEMPRMDMRAVRHHVNACLLRVVVPHRAGADALQLMQAYVYALCKEPDVVAL
jgi:hypothetical protein